MMKDGLGLEILEVIPSCHRETPGLTPVLCSCATPAPIPAEVPPMLRPAAAIGLAVLLAGPSFATAADAKPVSFQEDVLPIFRGRCNTCHNADKQKGGLSLENFGGAMAGGGSGKVIEPGDADASTLWLAVSHAEEPFMPPNADKLPDAELAVIKAWIAAGAPETPGGAPVAKAKPKFEFKLDPAALGKPVGPPAMPEKLATEPAVVSARPGAVTAMATSPWAPLVAIAGHKQVVLYRTDNQQLVGVWPFPEGTIHVLKFSRSGALLLAGGGRGGQSGLAVAWDVKTGARVFEVGKEKEYDAVMAADISPDHGQVALGGPGRVVRVYSTADNQLLYELKKHTEWITAVEFSPDGVLLATGDRNNGLFAWEAQTGREYFELRGHTGAITDVTWRLDSNVLASASEDGSIRLWEMENGTQIKTWAAHGGGTLAARFAPDGRLATAGRDLVPRTWKADFSKERDFEGMADIAMEATFAYDGNALLAADASGQVRLYDSKDGRRLANLAANPAPVAARLEQARTSLAAAQPIADKAAADLAAAPPAVQAAAAAVAAATTARDAAQAAAVDRSVALGSAEGAAAGSVAAAKAVTELLASAKAAEAALVAAVDQAVAAKAAAPEIEAARGRAKAAAERSAGIVAAVAKLQAEVATAAAAMTARQAEAPAAIAAAAARRAEFDAAVGAKAAADKAVADLQVTFAAAAARLETLRAEADRLAVEHAALAATKAALSSASAAPAP